MEYVYVYHTVNEIYFNVYLTVNVYIERLSHCKGYLCCFFFVGNALQFTFFLLEMIYFMFISLKKVYVLLISRCKIVYMRAAKAMGNLRISQAHLNNHCFAIQ